MAVEYTFAAHPTTYGGVRFRSRLEASWAVFFDALGWRWEYEPFDLKGWVPDFLIYGAGRDALVEVKPITKIDDDVINKISNSADGRYHLMLAGVSPVYEREYSMTQIFSSCECGDSRCIWQYRFIVRANDKYDIVFGHWPYMGLTTGVVIPSEDVRYSPYCGDAIFQLWNDSKNKTQWRAPR